MQARILILIFSNTDFDTVFGNTVLPYISQFFWDREVK